MEATRFALPECGNCFKEPKPVRWLRDARDAIDFPTKDCVSLGTTASETELILSHSPCVGWR